MKAETPQGSWGDIHTWWVDWAKDKLFRVWRNQEQIADFCFIDQVIDIGHDIMLGLSTYSSSYDNLREPGSLTFALLSQIRIAWYQDDLADESFSGGWTDDDFERVKKAYECAGISTPEDINNVSLP